MTQKTIDTLWLKVSGKMNINEMFELGDEIEGVLRGQIVKKELRDQQDGTIEITYILKPTINEFKKQ